MKWVPAALVVASACAGPAPARMPYREAFGEPTIVRSLPTDAELRDSLKAFAAQSRDCRQKATRGAPMPAEHAQAWASTVASVDQYLQRSPERTSSVDVARARALLDSELELDAQLWGDLPAATGESALRIIAALSARLSAVTALTVKHRVSPAHFRWPVTPVVVTSPWGHRVHPITGSYSPHQGIDLLADTAQPVMAAYAGTVTFAGWHGGHGKSVELQHDPVWATRYSHLQVWLVEPGSKVEKGQVIGLAGSTGQSTGVHLHFELLHFGEALDPEEALPPAPVSATMTASGL